MWLSCFTRISQNQTGAYHDSGRPTRAHDPGQGLQALTARQVAITEAIPLCRNRDGLAFRIETASWTERTDSHLVAESDPSVLHRCERSPIS